MTTPAERLHGPERSAPWEAAPLWSARAPLARAAGVQAVAGLLTLALAGLAQAADVHGGAMVWALVQGFIAAGLARVLGMEWWWLALHALFVPALVGALGTGLPPAYALVAFLALLAVHWNAPRGRVPLHLSSPAAARALAAQLPQQGGFRFIDLGSGLGGVLARLAHARPGGRYYGIESAPLPFVLSRLRAALSGDSFGVAWGDLENVDLSGYDFVYAYLSPAAMDGLWRKACREMRRGSVLISNGFAVPGVAPTLSVDTGGGRDARLLLWCM